MGKPSIVVFAGEELFASFFDERRQRQLSKLARWSLCTEPALDGNADTPLNKADALITTWDSPAFFSTESMKSMPNVRMIAHCGGEVKRRFELPLFRKLTITNTAQPMARPVAELGVAFLLYAARNVELYRAALRLKSNRIYQDLHIHGGSSEPISGSEIGMIGFGRIGHAMVDMLRSFNIRWHVYDPYASLSLPRDSPVQFASLSNVLKRSKLLVMTAAATEKTRNMLDRNRLAMLPDGALIVNVARGSLIDLAALTSEVTSGRLRCALDVTDPEEPLPIEHPLRNCPGAILTPHIGGGGRTVRGEMADVAIDDLERFFRGDKVRNRVTATMLGRMT